MSAKRFSADVSWPRALAYAIAAVVMAVVVGELVAMLIFAGSSDRRLDEQAARSADAAPAVVAASADLERTRQSRTALDDAVVDASRQRDEALVVARCEFNPSSACPQTHITGVPGAGPEHRTADEFLADTQGSSTRRSSSGTVSLPHSTRRSPTTSRSSRRHATPRSRVRTVGSARGGWR